MVDRRTMRTLPKVAKRKLPGFAKLVPVVAAVDAAKHAPAWALAEGGELVGCGFDTEPGTSNNAYHPTNWYPINVCVLEASRSYGSKDAGKHGDILAESIGGALCAGSMRAGEVVLIAPDEWAGSASSGKGTAKPPRHQAVWEALTARERALVEACYTPQRGEAATLWEYIRLACEAVTYGRGLRYGNKIHNILDAVGLLLYALGRIGRAGAKIKVQQPRPESGTVIHGVRFKKVRGL